MELYLPNFTYTTNIHTDTQNFISTIIIKCIYLHQIPRNSGASTSNFSQQANTGVMNHASSSQENPDMQGNYTLYFHLRYFGLPFYQTLII